MRSDNDSTSRQILRTALTDSSERSSSKLSSIRRLSAFGTKKDRVVHIDPGLLTNEQLLEAQGGRRRTLERLLIEPGALNEKPRAVFKEKGRWFLDSAHIKISFDDFMLGLTIFVLFGDELRLLFFPPSTDSTFESLNTIAFVIFFFEIVMNSWIKSDFSRGIWKIKGYMFSFFFWLDLMALLSLITDMNWLIRLIGIQSIFSASNSRGVRSNFIGSKFSRVLRMARLIRLVKLYKFTSKRKRDKQVIQDLQWLIDSDNSELSREEIEECLRQDRYTQSKVGTQLSDIITRRVIVAVLLMLCVVPLLSYQANPQDEIDAVEYLQEINKDVGVGNSIDCNYLVDSSSSFLEFTEKNLGGKFVIGLSIFPTRCSSETLIDFVDIVATNNLRSDFIESVSSSTTLEDEKYEVIALYNLTSFTHAGCWERIYLTVLVVVMLVVLSIQFNHDAEKLILHPIDNMMEMVNMVANEPLEDFDFTTLSSGNQYETKQVQVAIQKITALLRVGFGIAGAEIISKNMCVEGATRSAILDPMIPGKRIYAIFGFCDIHDFDHCTERLEDEIMTFVNKVADIVHEEVSRWGGSCNKNLGNAFLMVWRMGDEATLSKMNGTVRRRSLKKSITADSINKPDAIDLRRIPGLDIMSDKALIGFLKVIIGINRDSQILSYRRDPRLQKDGVPFKLRMGFGLHAGWAIEGAVGSLQKVDATYLSPHVNMAARMEAASRQFGVALLLTHNVYELMSKPAQACCRKVDVVTVKGSAIPMPVYTSDTLQNQHFPRLKTPKYTDLKLNDVLHAHAETYSPSLWEHDIDLVQLRRLISPTFTKTSSKGVEAYLNGDWAKAKSLLEKADEMMLDGDSKGDGPSRTLLRYMGEKLFVCPEDWQGFRPLTSK